MSEMTFRLNSPLTKEDWNLITDAEFEHSDGVTFTTPSGKEVEFRKVVHGEWIKMDKRGNNVRCSKCGNTLDLRGVNAGRGDANYCPNCGAYMRGEDDAEIH